MHIRLPGMLVAAVVVAQFPLASASAVLVPTWTEALPVPAPAGSPNNILEDVTVLSPTEVWAVGSWWGSAPRRPLAARWVDGDWIRTPVPTTSGGERDESLNAVDATAANDVWAAGNAGGTPLMVHYDGTAWSLVSLPAFAPGSSSSLNDVDMLTADDGWAVGETDSGPLILRRQFGTWEQLALPSFVTPASLTSVFAASAKDVWVAGTRTTVDGRQLGLILHWDGLRWTPAKLPGRDDQTLQGIAGTGSDVWAVGSTCAKAAGPATCAALALHLVDGVWQIVPSSTGVSLTGVFAFRPDDVWVVGQNNSPIALRLDHVEHWDGRRFTVDTTVAAPVPPLINGGLSSLVPLAAVAGDRQSGVIWAVGWVGSAIRSTHAVYRH